MAKKKVLIIEDGKPLQKLYLDLLKDTDVEVVQAFTLEEATRLFEEHKDSLDLISFDFNLGRYTTIDLIKKIKPQFAGVMVAASFEEHNRRLQMEAGCTRDEPEKDIPRLIKNLFF